MPGKPGSNFLYVVLSTVSAFESSPDKAKVETLFKILASMGLELHLSERLAPETSSGWQEEW